MAALPSWILSDLILFRQDPLSLPPNGTDWCIYVREFSFKYKIYDEAVCIGRGVSGAIKNLGLTKRRSIAEWHMM
jgi:hypothetical protein